MAFPTTGILDNFNRGDGALGSNWVDMPSKYSLTISTNQCKSTDADGGAIWYVAKGADVEVYVTLPNVENNVYLFARMDCQFEYGYSLEIGGASVQLKKWLAGSSSNLGSAEDVVRANNSAFGLEIIGSDIKIYHKPSGGSWSQVGGTISDSSFLGAGLIGLEILGTNQTADDFGGGTVGTSGIYVTQKRPDGTLIPDSAAGAGTVTSGAFANAVSEGSLVIAYVTWYEDGAALTLSSFSDSKGNTWTIDKQQAAPLVEGRYYPGAAIGHCIVASGKGGSGFTVTATSSDSDSSTANFAIGAIEVLNGTATISVNSGNGTGTAYSSGAVNPSGSNLYVALLYTDLSDTTPTRDDLNWIQRHEGIAQLTEQDTYGTGSKTGSWTGTASHEWAAVIASYQQAGGTAGSTSSPILRNSVEGSHRGTSGSMSGCFLSGENHAKRRKEYSEN